MKRYAAPVLALLLVLSVSAAWAIENIKKPGSTDGLLEGPTHLYYTDARARAALSSTATGLTYTAATGVISLTTGYAIPTTTALGHYDTAYGWGDHASAGYLINTLGTGKGTLIGFSAANTPGTLAAGTNAQVLTADSTQTLGIKWAAISGGNLTATYVLQTADATLPNAQVLGSLTTGLMKVTAATGVITAAVSGVDYQPPPAIQYSLLGVAGHFTPVIPAAGAECRWILGVDTDGTTWSGITGAITIDAPITGTPTDGQRWMLRIYDNATAQTLTFVQTAGGFTALGVVLPATSNGTLHKAVVLSGIYSKAANLWKVLGVSYE